ncbi:MAG: Ig-like domain-containing protein, partial [Candidatus Thorarchaeota archaeon]
GVFRTVVSYTPDSNWYGSTSAIYYELADATGAHSATAYVHITVNPVNDAPVGVDDSYTIDEDTSLLLPSPGVLANDYDVDGDAISLDFLTFPQHGGYTIGSNGLFNYYPAPDWYGTDSFTYRVYDGTAYSGVVTVTVTVEPVNDAPVAVDDNVVTDEDTPIIIDFMANDYDIDDTFDWAYVQWNPNEIDGELELVHNYEAEPGVFRTVLRYIPDPDWHGSSSSIIYGIQDSFGAQASAQIFITVNPVNDAPVAVDDYVVTDEDTPVLIDFMANDYDVDDAFDWSLIAYNMYDIHGEIDLLSDYEVEPGVFRDVLRYTPDPDWYGTTSTLHYRITDASGADSPFAYIHITVTPVNDGPVAVDDAYNTDEDVPLIVTTSGVIANDHDIDCDSLTAILVDTPLHGSVTLNADGSLNYVPDADWYGVDTLTYQVFDGTDYSNIAIVTITVNPVNDAPVAVDDTYTTYEDTILLSDLVTGVLTNDFDIDGDTLIAGLVSGPSHGILTLNPDGSFSYIPDANWFGVDEFVYEVSDGVLTDIATVTIIVHSVNDAPVANDDSYFIDEDTILQTVADTGVIILFSQDVIFGVLANDFDVDGDELIAILVTGPSHGSLILNADGSFTYTPNANWHGVDSFIYEALDGALTDTATVTITVNPVNDAPVAVDDAYTTDEDTVLLIDSVTGVLANDFDIDGDMLIAGLVSGPNHGILTLDPDGSFSYIPDANWYGVDSFVYEVSDGVLTDVATVTITRSFG